MFQTAQTVAGTGCRLSLASCKRGIFTSARADADLVPRARQSFQERLIIAPSNKRFDAAEIGRLLARTSLIRTGCDLDLLVFLYRHPRTLLTSEQIAAFVGRDMKVVAEALDMFIAAGFVERLHNPTHAARMYLLVVHGPEGKGLNRLLELASTRQGRQEILALLNSSKPADEERPEHLRLVKGVCA